MTLAIPASAIVPITPSVLSAGGTALDLSGLVLTDNMRMPVGSPLSFPSAPAVAAYFGPLSKEAGMAAVYFLGFNNSNKKPGAMLFVRYPLTAASAYLRSGKITGLSIAALQALAGTLAVSIDGAAGVPPVEVSLATATSFSAAAGLIASALALPPIPAAALTASIADTVMTVSDVTTGPVASGQTVIGNTVTPETTVVEQLSGTTGGIGTYTISPSQTVVSEAMTTTSLPIVFDSVSGSLTISSATTGPTSSVSFFTGTLAAALGLTQASGAVQSLGAAPATPAAAMGAVVAATQNWASFTTTFNPDGDTGLTAGKMAFATWNNAQNNRFAYVAWDTDITPTESFDAPACFGALLAAGNYSGIIPVWDQTETTIASFTMGAIASIDFTELGGRSTLAFKSQSGIEAGVTDQTVAENLIQNGYNFYGRYATGNDDFLFFYPGQVSGDYKWIDSYIDQIWLNNQFQLALMVLLTQVKAIPYNPAGDTLITASVMDVITQGLNFGAFVPGVVMSALQIAEVNAAAGVKIDRTLSDLGWYFQSKAATTLPQQRKARGTPPCSFWYMDGGSVQKLNLASVEVQ